MKLKIYSLEGGGNYAGGLAVVAAFTPKQAIEMANKLSSSVWSVHYDKAVWLRGMNTTYKKPFVVAHFEFGE